MILSLSSEIHVELGTSKTYLRLLVVLYLLTAALVINSSLYILIKVIVLFYLLIELKKDWKNKKPRNNVSEIQFKEKEWILVESSDKVHHYKVAKVLIHNSLFQLIEFKNPGSKKLIVLFCDQTSSMHRRLLHLKIAQN